MVDYQSSTLFPDPQPAFRAPEYKNNSQRNKTTLGQLSITSTAGNFSWRSRDLYEEHVEQNSKPRAAMVNPFDLKTVFFARHAQHVVLIHFPIALFITAVAFDLATLWTKRRNFADAAYCNLSVAAISTLPVLVTGVLAWQLGLEGQPLKGVLLLHLILGVVSSGMIWLVWWIHFQARRRAVALPRYRLAVEVLGVAIIALTGHLGGFLSGVNGPG
jgi:uncharacterized membrane protein